MLNKRGVQPYPRVIYPKDGSPKVTVNSSSEETAITGELLDEAGDPVDLHEDHPDTLPPDAAPVTPEQITKLAEIEKSSLDKPPAIVEAGQVEVPPEVIKAGDGW